jgi:hypothetical protein
LGAYADGGRSTLPLRGTNNFDLSFGKRVNVTGHETLEFRAEMYNAFNHSQFTPGRKRPLRFSRKPPLPHL